jgi:hypothetical protein
MLSGSNIHHLGKDTAEGMDSMQFMPTNDGQLTILLILQAASHQNERSKNAV